MKALTLRSSITKPSLITRSGFTTGRVGVAFLLAGLITTANWFIQGELTEADNTRANEIIKRVTDKKTVSGMFVDKHSHWSSELYSSERAWRITCSSKRWASRWQIRCKKKSRRPRRIHYPGSFLCQQKTVPVWSVPKISKWKIHVEFGLGP